MDGSQAAQIKQANQECFNKVSANGAYDNHPFVEQVSRQIADIIKVSFIFDKGSTVLLDYACGIGQMSRHLARFTKKIIGVDISQGMVDYYNQYVYNQGIPPNQMHAIRVQLTGADTDLDGQKFDIIVCALAYHHLPDINAVTKMLASLLKPGTGKLFVADLMTYDASIFRQSATGHVHRNHSHSHAPEQHTHSHSHALTRANMPVLPYSHSHSHAHSHLPALPHSHSHSHAHSHSPEQAHSHSHSHSHARAHILSEEEPLQGSTVVRKCGFSESDIHTVFSSAGLVDWEFIEGAATAEMMNKRVDVFLAVGRRP